MFGYQRNTAKTFAQPAGKSRIVETAGFRSTKQQIEEYMSAGRRLGEYRRKTYDFQKEDDIPEDYNDPTRTPGYDPADAMGDLRRAEENLKRSAKEKKDKAQADKDNKSLVENVTKVTEEKTEETEVTK